ncbi:MAG: T9SS type A sorting domain-containing protein [Mariniphaga sp.]|nr:T9SS type A sorting domain-containing protein [Mariniphaga sp.]MDD4225784.1 T9SS type A sorting domain-containing protein [Mariniphaga sp.]
MKKFKISLFLLVLVLHGFSQSTAIRLIEYKPAPGQHINMESSGTPAAAQQMTESFNKLVSLGSFGGYVVLGFRDACINHPDNPYGIDFTVFGNAFPGSSEPGVIWVMQDENQNGKPDDTWYEIAGSSHFHSKTRSGYELTYFRQESRDVYWEDHTGNSGWIMANDYNLQEYYPSSTVFPDYPHDSVTFNGTLLAPAIDFSNALEIRVAPLAFGYADNKPRKQGVELYQPDNPYTGEVEGAGGDPVDISWAIDPTGNYVNLDSIHFIKIVSGNLNGAGWLGEISTDVAWVEPVRPNPEITGTENMLVVYPYTSRLLAGDSTYLEACCFEKGRKVMTPVLFSSQNEQVVQVDPNGRIRSVKKGNTSILISAGSETQSVPVWVVVPDSIRFTGDISSVYPGDSVELTAQVYDDELFPLDLPVQFHSSNPDVGVIIHKDGQLLFEAGQSGETILTISVEGFSIQKSILVKVHAPGERIRIFFTLKNDEKNLLPFQWIEVGAGDLNAFVQNRHHDYSLLEKPSLFHALAAGLQQANVPFRFRDDEASGGKLYLYSVEDDGLFFYGWGGRTDPVAFARAWIARVNNQSFVNDFNRIDIADGDTLALYHVSNITNSWNYSQLISHTPFPATGGELEVEMEQTVCTYADGVIFESGFIPVAQAEVLSGAGSYFTGSDGLAVFILNSDLPLVISSGNNAVMIVYASPTGSSPVVTDRFRVYPNPVENELILAGGFPFEPGIFQKELPVMAPLSANSFPNQSSNTSTPFVRVITPDGRLILEQQITTWPFKIDFSGIPAGIFTLVVSLQDRVEVHKIMKQAR